MSDNQENNETASAKTQPNVFAQFKKPAIALILILILVSFGKQYNNPNQYKKQNPANNVVTPEIPAANQQPENPASVSLAESEPPAVAINPEITKFENERLNELEEKITRMQAAHETEINDLKEKFAAQSAVAQSKANSILSALVAFGQLKDAANSGRPYEGELNQLLKITAGDEDTQEILSGLKNNSGNGIITPDLLKEKFPPIARQAIFSKDESSYKNILHRFITIRKMGEQPGDDDESIIARAEYKIAHDNLKGALNELESLTPQAQNIFADWSHDARNWLDTQEKLAQLQLLITQTEIAPQP